MLKKLICGIALLCAIVMLYAVDASAGKKIGVLVWSRETHYTEAASAVLEQLKKEGFGEPSTQFVIENADGNKAKAAELAQKFFASKMDLVIAVGTSAAIAAVQDIKSIPVVFSMVYDPVESKIAKSWKSSGNNTTGTSSKVPMSLIINTLKQLSPVKRLAVLYTPGEKNSELLLKDLEGLQVETQIKIIPVPLSRKEEVTSVISDVVGVADAIYLSGSSIVGSTASMIAETAAKAKVITVTHLTDMVDKGALLGVCANPHAEGLLTGIKAAKVLKGANPASIAIEPLKKFDVTVNMKTVRIGGIEIPTAFMKLVTKTLD